LDKNQIPETIVNFNVYEDGEKLLGLSGEITLPQFEAMTETISGAGIAGEYETPIPGHFASQSMDIPFRMIYDDTFSLMKPEGKTFVLRASQQSYDVVSGKKIYEGLKITTRGLAKSMDPGKIAIGKMSEPKVTQEVVYIKIEKAGKTLLEFDKNNMIYVIDGVDYLEEIRNQI